MNNNDSLQHYLQEIGRFRLLTPEQEIQYSREIQSLMALKNHLRERLLQVSPKQEKLTDSVLLRSASLEETRAIKKGLSAREQMINSNLRLVVAIAKRYSLPSMSSMELLDLIQEGNMGLQHATERYNATLGYRFSTYAYWWIRQAVTRAISQKGCMIRLPVHLIESIGRWKRMETALEQELMRPPTDEDVAKAMGLPLAKIQAFRVYTMPLFELDRPHSQKDETVDLLELIPDESQDLHSRQANQHLKQEIEYLFDEFLDINQQVIIERRHMRHAQGKKREREDSRQGIAKDLKISRDRVRQLEAQAIDTLRQQISTTQRGQALKELAFSA